jgi:hypothetical protein
MRKNIMPGKRPLNQDPSPGCDMPIRIRIAQKKPVRPKDRIKKYQ